MNNQIPATDTEQRLTVEGLLQEGRREGRQEGRREGRREGVLDLARHLVDRQTLRDLESLEDLDELERRVLELVKNH